MMTTANILPLQDRTTLVTHATSCIGAAIATALAAAGAKVMINYQDDREKAEQLAEQIRHKQGQAMIFRADLSQENQVKSMLDVLMAYWGRLDILVNNLNVPEHAVYQFMHSDLWHQAISINLALQFLKARQTSRHDVESGINPQSATRVGKIICVAANAAVNSKQDFKTMLDMLVRELSAENIRVHGIAAKSSNMLKLTNLSIPEQDTALFHDMAMAEDCKVNAIAQMATRLVTDAADACNGATFTIDNENSVFPRLENYYC